MNIYILVQYNIGLFKCCIFFILYIMKNPEKIFTYNINNDNVLDKHAARAPNDFLRIMGHRRQEL